MFHPSALRDRQTADALPADEIPGEHLRPQRLLFPEQTGDADDHVRPSYRQEVQTRPSSTSDEGGTQAHRAPSDPSSSSSCAIPFPG